jgi:hypothetical protein
MTSSLKKTGFFYNKSLIIFYSTLKLKILQKLLEII